MTKETKTAVITGASSGIGEVFAQRLAAEGYNLILVARREEKLNEIGQGLAKEYGIEAEAHVADLASSDDVVALAERIGQISDLEMLVNNAGFGTVDEFPSCDIERHMDMIQVHVSATVRLTRAALPGMIERNRGGVINVSSVAAFLTGRGSCTYCATKAYLNSFSLSVQADLAETNVRVQALCPGFTYTGFHDTEELSKFERTQIPKMLWLKADYVVDCSLRALRGRKVICIPSFRYRLVVWVASSRMIGSVLKAVFSKRVDRSGGGR